MEQNTKNTLKGSLMLLLTACIWGSAFVAQRLGMTAMGPFTFNAIRSLIGGTVLLPLIWWQSRHRTTLIDKKELFKGGITCGLLLGIASTLQQIGLVTTSAGKAGFITAFYIVLVPILGIFLGRRASLRVWGCVGVALYGLYLLCMKEASFRLEAGDTMVLLCTLFFAMQILAIDHYVQKVDGTLLACVQFFTAGALCLPFMLIVEQPTAEIWQGWMALLYCGVFSSGVAYTLQIIGQKYVPPTPASLLMSMESVFAVLSGWLFLHEMMSSRELLGCLLVLLACLIAQLPDKAKETKISAKSY